jgi:nicotinamidase-related amidase
LHKREFDVFSNPNVPALLKALEPEAVVIYGVATDFCDRYTVEGLLRHLPTARLYLVTDAVRAIHAAEGERLISSWRDRGVRMITVREIVEDNILQPHLPPQQVVPTR